MCSPRRTTPCAPLNYSSINLGGEGEITHSKNQAPTWLDVRFGLSVDITPCPRNVRLTPGSRHSRVQLACLSTRTGLMHCNKQKDCLAAVSLTATKIEHHLSNFHNVSRWLLLERFNPLIAGALKMRPPRGDGGLEVRQGLVLLGRGAPLSPMQNSLVLCNVRSVNDLLRNFQV